MLDLVPQERTMSSVGASNVPRKRSLGNFLKYPHNKGHMTCRIKATTGGGYSLTIPYSHNCNPHMAAAKLLAQKMGWGGTMIEGHTTEGSVFVFSYGDKFEI